MDRSLIDQYVAGADKLRRAVSGLTADQLRARPIEGRWSIQEVAAHLLDADIVGIDRMKRIIAMDEPTLLAYNETAYTRSLCAHELDIDLLCEAFEINRRVMGAILERQPDAVFERVGLHDEDGRRTLGQFLEQYVGHVDHHLAFVREKLAAMGV